MADELKVTKKVIDAISENFSKLAEDEAVSVGNKIGIDEDLVKQVRANPKSKQATEFFKNIIEKTKPAAKEAGNLVNAAQALFDQVAGRAPRMDEAAYAASKAAAEKVGGGRPPAFEPSEAKFVGPGGQRRIPKPMAKDVNYTFGRPDVGEQGGPLVPAETRALTTVREKLKGELVPVSDVTVQRAAPERYAPPQPYGIIEKNPQATTAVVPYGSRFDRPVASPEEIAQAASRAKAGPAGEGVSEFTPGIKVSKGDESAQQAERAAELELNMDLSMTPSPESMRKAGKLAAGAGAAGGLTMAGITGMKLFGDKPLASQEGAGDTTRVAEVAGTPDVKAMADKALPHLPDQAKEVIQNQVQKVLSIEERLDKELSSARARYDKEVARKELLQAIETVMHGLVTALGAKAALDRGSPFAIDFSKGPQVNWESKFANLQKDFELQTNSIVKKYDLEQKERLEQQKAAESSRRYEERMALEREKLGVEKAKAGQQVAKQQAEEAAKLNAEQQKQYNTNLKTFALLKEAIETKNLGNIQQYGIALGAKPETIDEIKAEASKGGFRKAIEFAAEKINLIPPTKDAAEQLRPQKPAAQSVQADEVVVELNGVQGAIPANQVDAFVKANPGAKIIK